MFFHNARTQIENELGEPLDVQFVREDSGVYYYGSKRVFVKIEGGKIILRVGGGYMRIEEFIRIFTSEELEKLKSRTTKDGRFHRRPPAERSNSRTKPADRRPPTPSN